MSRPSDLPTRLHILISTLSPKMVMSSGYQSIFAIILAACYLQGTQCMNHYSLLPKSSEKLEETNHLSAGPGVSYNDFAKTAKEKGVCDDRVVQRTEISQGDIHQYFSSVGPISKPTPGSASQQLDLIFQKAKTGLVDRDYWPAVHMKSLAEDFELTSLELGRLVASLKKGKTYSRTNPMTIRTQLTESVGDLMDTHKRLKQYINHHLGKWAAKNHLPSPTIFEDHVRPQEKKNALGREEAGLMIGAANIKETLPLDRLDKLAASMCGTLNIRDDREDPDLWAIHRIYIKTVDQLYKYGLITQKKFEQWIQNDEYVRAAARNMFWHFSHIEKEYQNPLYRNSDILVGLPYSLPFINMLNVLSPRHKEMFFYEIVRLDALDWIAKMIEPGGEERLTPGETTLARSFKTLFENDLVFSAFNDRDMVQRLCFEEKACLQIRAIIRIFTDPEIWNRHWGSSEAIRIMGQILKFINQNFLQAESRKELRVVGSVKGMYTDVVKNKLDLLSSRAQAIVELEDISRYLGGKFPLRNDLNIKKPIPPTVELSLIKELIENSPSLKAYRSKLEIQDDGLTEMYNKEIDDKIKQLETKIEQLKAQHSGSNSKRGTLSMIKGIFKGKGKASADNS